MAIEQIDSFLSEGAKKDFELIKEGAGKLREVGNTIIDINKKVQEIESRRSATVKELKENLKLLDQTNDKLVKQQGQMLKLSKENEALKQKQIDTDAKLLKLMQQEEKVRQNEIKTIELLIRQKKREEEELKKNKKALEDASDAYKQLDLEHKKLERDAKILGVVYGATSKEFLDAANAANQVGKKLKEIDAAIGNHRRNVGNYSSMWNGLGMSVQQVFRELPNLAQSFQLFTLSVSNNLPILADEIKRVRLENKALIANGKPTVSLFKQITAAIFSWQTALTIAITVLVAYSKEIGEFIKGTDSAKEKLKNASKEIQATFSEEAHMLQVLKARFEDTTTSMDDKKEIIDELNKKYKDQVDKIKSVSDAEEFFTKKTPLIINALMLRAKAEAALLTIREESSKQLKLESDPSGALTGLEKAAIATRSFVKWLSGISKGSLSEIYNWDVVTNGANKANEELQKSRVLTDDLLKQYIKFQNEASKLDVLGGFDTGGGADKDKKAKREKQFKEFYDQYVLSLKERNEAQKEYDSRQIEQGLSTNKQIIDDEKAFLEDRLKALEEYYSLKSKQLIVDMQSEVKTLQEERKVLLQKQKDFEAGRLKLTELQQKALTNEIETNKIKQRDINLKWENQMIDDEIESNKKRLELIKKVSAEQAKAVLEELDSIAANYKYTGRSRKDSIGVLNEQLDLLKNAVLVFKAMGLETSILESNIDKISAALGKLGSRMSLEEFKKAISGIVTLVNSTMDLVHEMQNIVRDVYKHKIENLERESQLIKENSDKEIESIQKQALTEEEKEKRIRDAKAKSDAQEKVIAQRLRLERIKQAKFDRVANIGDAIAKGALAVLQAIATLPPPYSYIVAGISGALATAQIARVIATPIPSYADGTLDHIGGMARVGEAGSELIVTPDGKMRKVSKETILDLPRHTRVYNEEQLRDMGMIYPRIFKDMKEDYNFKRLENVFSDGFRTLNRTLINKNMVVNNKISAHDMYKLRHTNGK